MAHSHFIAYTVTLQEQKTNIRTLKGQTYNNHAGEKIKEGKRKTVRRNPHGERETKFHAE
jgi:hypothetical protein